MNKELLNYLLSIPGLKEEDYKNLANDLETKTLEKADMLSKQGEFSNKCYFVLKGCIRQYFIDEDGNEHSANFFTEFQPVINNENFSLEAVEDCILIDGSPEKEESILKKYPQIAPIIKSMEDQNYKNLQENFANFVSSSPEKRYLQILRERPSLINRVPQHQLASSLGIKPESLSRLKKRLSLNN